jgi:hypothetical protein
MATLSNMSTAVGCAQDEFMERYNREQHKAAMIDRHSIDPYGILSTNLCKEINVEYIESMEACSYFEGMCKRAELGDMAAQAEVDRMVGIMNDDAELERSKIVYDDQTLAEFNLVRIDYTKRASSSDYDDVLAFDEDLDLMLPIGDDDSDVHSVTKRAINNNAQPWLGGSGHGGGMGGSGGRTVAPTPAPFPQAGTAISPGLSTPIQANGAISITIGSPMSQSADLPKITFLGHDENEKPVQMVLDIEPNITTNELMRVMMLMNVAMTNGTSSFSVYAYIKKHNLERHFRITQ